jgi:hypothetical protein
MNISFPESLESFAITAQYPGEYNDALTDGDKLAMAIIRGNSKECLHTYDDGINTVRVIAGV